MEERRLLCVLAHPDDESLGVGGALAAYAADGVATHLVVATRGERGWQGAPDEYPGVNALATIRESELRAAAAVLGVRSTEIMDYPDGEVAGANPEDLIEQLVGHVRRVRPQVVITFPPDGITGHPDHIAVSQLTTAAVVCAADPVYGDGRSYRVAKLYYLVSSQKAVAEYNAVFGDFAMEVDGVRRRAPGWPEWAITTRVNAAVQWRRVWQAVTCHQTQLPDLQPLATITPEMHRSIWGTQEFYRAFSLVNCGSAVEDDLFAGLR